MKIGVCVCVCGITPSVQSHYLALAFLFFIPLSPVWNTGRRSRRHLMLLSLKMRNKKRNCFSTAQHPCLLSLRGIPQLGNLEGASCPRSHWRMHSFSFWGASHHKIGANKNKKKEYLWSRREGLPLCTPVWVLWFASSRELLHYCIKHSPGCRPLRWLGPTCHTVQFVWDPLIPSLIITIMNWNESMQLTVSSLSCCNLLQSQLGVLFL